MRKLAVLLLVLTTIATGCSANKEGVSVDVNAKEYAFEPATLSVAAGRVSFRVKNIGAEEHEFEIFEGDKVLDEVEGISPGLTRTLTTTLSPGTYLYVCKDGGHDAKGMKGTLTVT